MQHKPLPFQIRRPDVRSASTSTEQQRDVPVRKYKCTRLKHPFTAVLCGGARQTGAGNQPHEDVSGRQLHDDKRATMVPGSTDASRQNGPTAQLRSESQELGLAWEATARC